MLTALEPGIEVSSLVPGLLLALAPVNLNAFCPLTELCDREGGLALGDLEFGCWASFPGLSTNLAPSRGHVPPSPPRHSFLCRCPARLPECPLGPATRVPTESLSFPSLCIPVLVTESHAGSPSSQSADFVNS